MYLLFYRYYGLVITAVQGADRGLYSCHVDYQGFVQHVRHSVTVLGETMSLLATMQSCVIAEPPVIAKQPKDDIVQVRVGDTITLRCAASGHPNPGISWYKVHGDNDNGQVMATGLSVDLEVGHQDEGRVVCSADNGVGAPVNMSFYIVPVCKLPSNFHLQLFTCLL